MNNKNIVYSNITNANGTLNTNKKNERFCIWNFDIEQSAI